MKRKTINGDRKYIQLQNKTNLYAGINWPITSTPVLYIRLVNLACFSIVSCNVPLATTGTLPFA